MKAPFGRPPIEVTHVSDTNPFRAEDGDDERALLEAGLIARADDRGDAVLQIAPPLISDAVLLDDIVDAMADVLADAGAFIGATADSRAERAA